MDNLSLPQKISISPDVLFQEISGECVLLNMKSEQYFGLDKVGTRIWQLLVEYGDTSDMITQLKLDFDVNETILVADLSNLIKELNEEGLITIES